ncbi:MAG: hypothetical protein HY982_02485 [Candidatus Magasanikbacteria bacterium]|nr:hypothetical protein [Candidatus Magasanikbacteria bacterium]
MFDDINNKTSNEPEDILAPIEGEAGPVEIKSALAHQKLRPVTPSSAGGGAGAVAIPSEPPALEEPEIEISPPLLSKKSLYVVIGVVIIAALVAGVIWAVWQSSKKKATPLSPLPAAAPAVPAVAPAAPAASEETTPPVSETPAAPEVAPAPSAAPSEAPAITAPPAPVDSDNDGLTDEEEFKYGTDYQKTDSDGDGLTDYEEIIIWKTNPLSQDTDGDSYSDGTEIKNGYNPLGAGKLLELPKK